MEKSFNTMKSAEDIPEFSTVPISGELQRLFVEKNTCEGKYEGKMLPVGENMVSIHTSK